MERFWIGRIPSGIGVRQPGQNKSLHWSFKEFRVPFISRPPRPSSHREAHAESLPEIENQNKLPA